MSITNDTSFPQELREFWKIANGFSRVLGAYREQLEDVGFTRDESVALCDSLQSAVVGALGGAVTQTRVDEATGEVTMGADQVAEIISSLERSQQ